MKVSFNLDFLSSFFLFSLSLSSLFPSSLFSYMVSELRASINGEPRSNFTIFFFSIQCSSWAFSNEGFEKSIFLASWRVGGATLITQLLIEDNYPTWARAMRMALDAKSKLGLMDSSITTSMAITHLEKIAWSKNNSMISSWILNSVSPHITAYVIYRNTAMEIWNSLRNRFSQANGPRIS